MNNNIQLPDKDKIYWTFEETRLLRINGRDEKYLEPTARSLCIIDGKGYGINSSGATYCVGTVDINGKPIPAITTELHQTAVDNKIDVSKPLNEENHRTNNIQAHNAAGYETPKNVGGRPRKTDNEISRTTKWRRKKEEQGILF